MQKKEAKIAPKKEVPKKTEERSSVTSIPRRVVEPQHIEEVVEEPEEETDVERIDRKLKEIQEKYS